MFPLTLLIIELVLDSRITTLKRKCRPTCDSNTVINCSYFTDVQYIIVYLYIQLVLFIEIFTFFFFFFNNQKSYKFKTSIFADTTDPIHKNDRRNVNIDKNAISSIKLNSLERETVCLNSLKWKTGKCLITKFTDSTKNCISLNSMRLIQMVFKSKFHDFILSYCKRNRKDECSVDKAHN